MTDRYAGFVVVLEQDMRSDDADAEQTIAAIRQIRGVADVSPVLASPETQIAEQRARLKLVEQIWQVLRG